MVTCEHESFTVKHSLPDKCWKVHVTLKSQGNNFSIFYYLQLRQLPQISDKVTLWSNVKQPTEKYILTKQYLLSTCIVFLQNVFKGL